MPTKIAIVYFSSWGHTKAQAQAVAQGVQSVAGVSVRLLTVDEATADMTPLNEADCIIFGCPTYMGGPAAQFKTFIDSASKIWAQQGWKDKLAAGFTNSMGPSGDKQNTLTSLWVNAMQHGMIWISQGLMPDGMLNRLSSWGGAMSQSPQGAAEPVKEDLLTAQKFGERVALVALRFAAAR